MFIERKNVQRNDIMNIDDVIGRLQEDFPDKIDLITRMLFNAGFMKSGCLVPGCEDQARAMILQIIPNANKYFYEKVSQIRNYGGKPVRVHRKRSV